MNIQEIISGLQRKIALQSNYITFYEAELIKSYSNNCEYSDGLKWELSYLRAEQTLDKRTLGMLIGQNKMIGSLSKLICVKQRRESFLYRECIKRAVVTIAYDTPLGLTSNWHRLLRRAVVTIERKILCSMDKGVKNKPRFARYICKRSIEDMSE